MIGGSRLLEISRSFGRAVVTAVWNAKRCAIAEGYVIMVSDAANELSEMRSPRRGS